MEELDEKKFEDYFEKLANLYIEHLNFKSTTDKTKAQIIEILEEIYQYGLDSDEGEFNEGWKTGHDIGYDEGYGSPPSLEVGGCHKKANQNEV